MPESSRPRQHDDAGQGRGSDLGAGDDLAGLSEAAVEGQESPHADHFARPDVLHVVVGVGVAQRRAADDVVDVTLWVAECDDLLSRVVRPHLRRTRSVSSPQARAQRTARSKGCDLRDVEQVLEKRFPSLMAACSVSAPSLRRVARVQGDGDIARA
eukprot:2074148-Rhodomonas_salina.3